MIKVNSLINTLKKNKVKFSGVRYNYKELSKFLEYKNKSTHIMALSNEGSAVSMRLLSFSDK